MVRVPEVRLTECAAAAVKNNNTILKLNLRVERIAVSINYTREHG